MRALWFVAPALVLAACGGSTSAEGTGGTAGTGAVSGGGGSGGTSGTGAVSGGGGSGNVGGSGGNPSWFSCTDPGTCLLLAKTCCGYCGPAPLSGYQGVNEKHASDWTGSLCSEPQACPDCISYEEPNYLSLCRGGLCTPVDLRLDSLSACSTDTDCRLRYGAGCCESCGGSGLVALNASANLASEVCSPFGGACPPCMPPPYPSNALAVCEAGHCAVKTTGLGGP